MKKRKYGVLKVTKTVKYSNMPALIKVGLDSDTVINILNEPHLFADILRELSNNKNLLHMHKQSIKEIPDILGREYNWDYNEAEEELEDFIRKYKIKIVPRFKGNPLLKDLEEKCRKKNIRIHRPDSFIIADFKVYGITKAYSGNDHFIEACRAIGIYSRKTPTPDKTIKDKLREMFKRRPKFGHR